MLIIDCGYWLCFVLGIGVLVERESFGVGISLVRIADVYSFRVVVSLHDYPQGVVLLLRIFLS